jgi:hypothetical protein
VRVLCDHHQAAEPRPTAPCLPPSSAPAAHRSTGTLNATMKFSAAVSLLFVASASAFAPASVGRVSHAQMQNAEVLFIALQMPKGGAVGSREISFCSNQNSIPSSLDTSVRLLPSSWIYPIFSTSTFVLLLTYFVSPLLLHQHNYCFKISHQIINRPQLKLPLGPTKTPSVIRSLFSTPVVTIQIAKTMVVLRRS